MLEVGVGRARRPARRARAPRARSAIASRCAAPVRTAVRRSGAAMKTASKMRLLREQPDRQVALARRPCRGRARRARPRGAAASSCRRRSARRGRSGRRARSRASIASRITNVPISRVTPANRRIDISPPPATDAARRGPPGRRRALRPFGPRAGVAVRTASGLVRGQADAALPAASSVQRRPRRTSPAA